MPTEKIQLNIEAWQPRHHNAKGFDCGNIRLNNFLQISAKKQQKDRMTRVFVAVEPGQAKILGYYTINVGAMEASDLAKRPRGTPSHNKIPILFLGQVAVDQAVQGRKIGSHLMQHVFRKALTIDTEVGCYALLLDVMPDENENIYTRRMNWYREFGFQNLASKNNRMLLPIQKIRQIIAAG